MNHDPARISRYLQEIREWGGRMNLVGSTAMDALQTHVEDSLAPAMALPRGARVVDLGSGAGFPGVPIAIVRPDLRIVLVEIRERRFHFLRHVVRTLELCCDVWRRSVDDPPAEPFDAVLVRALAARERALRMAAPWAGSEGEIFHWTRSEAIPEGFEEVGRIPVEGRGYVARVRVASVPRGTLAG